MTRLTIFYVIYTAFALIGGTLIADGIGFIYLTGQTTYGDYVPVKALLYSVGVTNACDLALRAFFGEEHKKSCGLFATVYGTLAGVVVATIYTFLPMPYKAGALGFVATMFAIAPLLLMLSAWDRSWRTKLGLLFD